MGIVAVAAFGMVGLPSVAHADQWVGSCYVISEPGLAGRFTDCSNDELSYLDLSNLDLRGAWFYNSTLTGTNFSGSDLSLLRNVYGPGEDQSASLSSVDATDAQFVNANLASADLQWAELQGADLSGATLTGTYLDSVHMDAATKLTDANLNSAYLGGVQADGTVLSGLRMRSVDLSGAALDLVDMRSTDLTGADLTGATISGDLSRTILTSTVWSQTMARGVNLTGANLTGARFINPNLVNAIFTGATFTGSSLVPTNVTKTLPAVGRVSYSVPQLTGVSTTCAPASGSVFNPGVTRVSCTVTNTGSRTSGTGYFNITVKIQPQASLTLSKSVQYYGVSPTRATVKTTPAVTGTATLLVDGKATSHFTVTRGAGSVTLPKTVAVGRHSISVSVQPSSTYYLSAKTASASLTVRATSTTSLSTSSTSQVYNAAKSVNVTAKVALANRGTPSGRVAFKVDGRTVATKTVSAGRATTTLPATTRLGSHRVTATYTPSNTTYYVGSTSSSKTLKVIKATSKTSLTASKKSQFWGSLATATFAAKVTALNGRTAQGSVRFAVDGVAVKVVRLNGGSARYAAPWNWKVGTHRVAATYLPSTPSTVGGSRSTSVLITVVWGGD